MVYFVIFAVLVLSSPIIITMLILDYRKKKKEADEQRARDIKYLFSEQTKRVELAEKKEAEDEKKRKDERDRHDKFKDRLMPQAGPAQAPPAFYMAATLESMRNDVQVVDIEKLVDKSHLPALMVENPVDLQWEDYNEADNKAILARNIYHKKLGYIKKDEKLQDKIIDWMQKQYPVYCVVTRVDEKFITLLIAFYTPLASQYSKSKTYILTRNTDEDSQKNIRLCDVDEKVSFSYDHSSKKYAVIAGHTIGYLSDAIESIIETPYVAIITGRELDDNVKHQVKITFYYE